MFLYYIAMFGGEKHSAGTKKSKSLRAYRTSRPTEWELNALK